MVNKNGILNVICAFDIETSTVGNENFMYVWQFGYKLPKQEAKVIMGRTWNEFICLLKKIQKEIGKKKLIIFVHNLAYEWQYLRSFEKELRLRDVFLLDARKPLSFTALDTIEFRCSYLQTNMSLAELTQKYQVEHQKLPDFDYSKVNFPDTQLTPEEESYCKNDVLGLCEAIEKQNELEGDTLETMPLTSTGYVRRDIKNARNDAYKELIKKCYPDEHTYSLLRSAFRGGNTVFNELYRGEKVNDVHCYDRVSSYPAVMITHKFPMTPFRPYGKNLQLSQLIYHIKLGKACLFTIHFFDIQVKASVMAPYISTSHIIKTKGRIAENGRLLKARETSMTITDIDFKVISQQYTWSDCVIDELLLSNYDFLPSCFVDVIKGYYKAKCELKGQGLAYVRAKAKVNACYGMLATKPIRENITYGKGSYKVEENSGKLSSLKYKDFTLYQWGVWTTAWARYELQKAIDLCASSFLYSDTDSVYYTGHVDFSPLNTKLTVAAQKHGVDGIGIWAHEADYSTFITIGLKQYACVDEDGKLHITIAGINKQEGVDKLGSIDNMKEGFVFKDGAKQVSYYDDTSYRTKEIMGHKVEITSYQIINQVDFTLGAKDICVNSLSLADLAKIKERLAHMYAQA